MRKIVTQIGSLPLEDVNEAVKYSLKHDIPFLPELPKKGDAMMAYIKNPGKLSCLEEFKKHKFDTVKIQCIGPATLMLAGLKEDEAMQGICEHITAITDDRNQNLFSNPGHAAKAAAANIVCKDGEVVCKDNETVTKSIL